MTSNRLARLIFPVVAVTTLVLGVSTAPASAVVVDLDPVRITAPNVDFGAGALVAGTPGFATLSWDITLGVTTPSISIGTLYATPGSCVRLRLESYDAFFGFIRSDTGPAHCAIAGGANQWSTPLSNPGDPLTIHAYLVLETFSGGVWKKAGSTTTMLF
jgi:hypothetical protein